MVVGRTSNFIEGFKSFTADDDLMLANLKQALEYSKEDLAIPDAKSKLNLPSSKNSSSNLNTNIPSTTMPIMMSTTTTPAITKSTMDMNMNKNMDKNMNKNMDKNMDMDTNMNMNKNMNTTRANLAMERETMPTKPKTTMPETFKNGKGNGKANGKSNGKGNNIEEKFRDVKMVRNIVEDEDIDDDESTDLDDDEIDEGEKMIEGFQGSIKLESRFARNILLALLLTAIGYLVVHSSMNNLIPLGDISPQLKKFKNLIYGGLFFLIAYICLEVF